MATRVVQKGTRYYKVIVLVDEITRSGNTVRIRTDLENTAASGSVSALRKMKKE
jgi:hypothetical protein